MTLVIEQASVWKKCERITAKNSTCFNRTTAFMWGTGNYRFFFLLPFHCRCWALTLTHLQLLPNFPKKEKCSCHSYYCCSSPHHYRDSIAPQLKAQLWRNCRDPMRLKTAKLRPIISTTSNQNFRTKRTREKKRRKKSSQEKKISPSS